MSGLRLFCLSLDVWSLWLSGPDLNVTCGAVLSEAVGSDLGGIGAQTGHSSLNRTASDFADIEAQTTQSLARYPDSDGKPSGKTSSSRANIRVSS